MHVSPSTLILKRRIKRNMARYKDREDLRLLRTALLDAPEKYQKVSSAAIAQFGRPFLGSFNTLHFYFKNQKFEVGLRRVAGESRAGITISIPEQFVGPTAVGFVKLGFDRGAILIESIQGKKGKSRLLNLFEKAVKMPWPKVVVKKIEAVGRRMGYTEIRFRDVETIYSYQDPHVYAERRKEFLEKHPEYREKNETELEQLIRNEIRKEMRQFYKKLYTPLGFTNQRADYWIKKL